MMSMLLGSRVASALLVGLGVMGLCLTAEQPGHPDWSGYETVGTVVGEVVEVKLPAGTRRYEISSIEFR